VRWAEIAIGLVALAAVATAFVFLLRRPIRSALAVPEKSIAVLPFENRSPDPNNAYFADGIQDEILTRLSNSEQRRYIDKAVDVVGPAVQKQHWTTIGRTEFSIANIQ
jgi:TolB-like protein